MLALVWRLRLHLHRIIARNVAALERDSQEELSRAAGALLVIRADEKCFPLVADLPHERAGWKALELVSGNVACPLGASLLAVVFDVDRPGRADVKALSLSHVELRVKPLVPGREGVSWNLKRGLHGGRFLKPDADHILSVDLQGAIPRGEDQGLLLDVAHHGESLRLHLIFIAAEGAQASF